MIASNVSHEVKPLLRQIVLIQYPQLVPKNEHNMLYVYNKQTAFAALVQFIRPYDDLFCEHFQLSLLRFHRELADIPFDMQTQWPWDITGRTAPGVSKRRDMRDLLITFSNAENAPKRCQYLI